MRISTHVLVSDIEPALNWVGGLIGAAADKRVASIEKQGTEPTCFWRLTSAENF